jgi:hypothetical protein
MTFAARRKLWAFRRSASPELWPCVLALFFGCSWTIFVGPEPFLLALFQTRLADKSRGGLYHASWCSALSGARIGLPQSRQFLRC